MNNDWLEFLTRQGATLMENDVRCYTDCASELLGARDGSVMADLSHRARIRVSGPDAAAFLQSQLTNNIVQLTDNFSQLNGYCTPKGRLLCLFRVAHMQADYVLSFPLALKTATLARLQKYVLMSKVTFTDLSKQVVGVGVAGSGAEVALRNHFGALPTQENGVLVLDRAQIVFLPGGRSRYEVYGEPAAMMEFWNNSLKILRPVGYPAWHWLNVETALPEVFPQTVEEFVPQMMNMDAVAGLSFTKGCYPGQEIVARMNYLGTLKRRMYLYHVQTNTEPQPGENVFSEHGRSDEGAGKIADAAPSPEGGYDCLAVLQIKLAEQGGLHLQSAAGTPLVARELPYPLPAKK